MKQSTNGFIQLEALISLSIIAPILTAITALLLQALYQYYKSHTDYLSQYTSIQARHSFEQAIRAPDSLSFLPSARIHKNGIITFTDDSANNVTHSKSTTKPSLESDALTTAQAIASNMLQVMTVENLGDQKLYTACALYPHHFQKDKESSFLYRERSYFGISTEGIFELVGQAWLTSESSDQICRTLELTHQKSMLFETKAPIAPVIKIIPLASLYTLYKDQNGILRYLSHRGVQNIENQPLEEYFSNIKISKKLNIQINTQLYTLTFQNEKNPLYIRSRVPRSSYLSALMIHRYES